MNIQTDIMDQVKDFAEEFMEKEYPDEAPYFHIAWDNFEKALQNSKIEPGEEPLVWDLKGPLVRDLEEPVRLEGDDTIMAPMVISAFHLLFTMVRGIESEPSESLKQEMLQFLSQKKFSLEFSMEIVDFFMEKRDGQ